MTSERHTITELMTAEVYGEWLSRNLEHEELVERVRDLFEDSGIALPRSMRLDLECFIRDRPSVALAECLAKNESPTEDLTFVKWCGDQPHEWEDDYALNGVSRRDFCTDRGPGRERIMQEEC